MNIETVGDLYVSELCKLYHVETELVDLLDEVAHDAETDVLADVFDEHRNETSEQIERLERAFDVIDKRAERRQCPTFDGLLKDTRDFQDDAPQQVIREVHSFRTGVMIERFEVGAYERTLALADILDLSNAAVDPLERNLDEERSTLEELETIAESDDLDDLLDRATR